jgi:hypothetical protein
MAEEIIMMNAYLVGQNGHPDGIQKMLYMMNHYSKWLLFGANDQQVPGFHYSDSVAAE